MSLNVSVGGGFSPKHHIPHYSFILIRALKTPIIIYLALMGNLITAGLAYLFYFFEKGYNPEVTSYWDAGWWAICTVSSVGYGDIVPYTDEGRIIGFVLIVLGLTLFLTFMAALVSVLNIEILNESAPIKPVRSDLESRVAELEKNLPQ